MRSPVVWISNSLILGFLSLVLLMNPSIGFAEEQVQKSSATLKKLQAEILEVEELREPKGGAIYTVKDLSSGRTLRLFADPHRTLIQMGTSTRSASDILGGTRATIIYRQSPGKDLPEIVFAKVTSSYYG